MPFLEAPIDHQKPPLQILEDDRGRGVIGHRPHFFLGILDGQFGLPAFGDIQSDGYQSDYVFVFVLEGHLAGVENPFHAISVQYMLHQLGDGFSTLDHRQVILCDFFGLFLG